MHRTIRLISVKVFTSQFFHHPSIQLKYNKNMWTKHRGNEQDNKTHGTYNNCPNKTMSWSRGASRTKNKVLVLRLRVLILVLTKKSWEFSRLFHRIRCHLILCILQLILDGTEAGMPWRLVRDNKQFVCLKPFEVETRERLLHALHIGTSWTCIQPRRPVHQASQSTNVRPAAVQSDAGKMQLKLEHQRHFITTHAHL